ncbi:hypothetical protein BJV82DRAFT_618928 [Fennellomyces sp. T-0311]|nr:hypothetical protein BJV82DRAFT_618928 [Fennellomyces sp. T-0311]
MISLENAYNRLHSRRKQQQVIRDTPLNEKSLAIAACHVNDCNSFPSEWHSNLLRIPDDTTPLKKASRKGLTSPLQWIHLLPYDVLHLIFDYLSMNELVVCLAVCRSWFSFIVDLPYFKHYGSVEMPSLATSSDMLEFMLTQQSSMRKLRVLGQTKQSGATILRFIMYSAVNFKLQSLWLQDWEYDKKCHEDTLYSLYHSLNQYSLEQLTLINMIEFPSIEFFARFFLSCKGLKQLTFVCNRWHQQGDCYEMTRSVSHEPLYQVSVAALPMLSLTYLRLSLPDIFHDHHPTGTTFPNIFPSCPNLRHLFMDSLDSIFHAHAIHEAFHHCHQLQDAIVSPLAELPPTIHHRPQIEYDSSMSFQKAALPRRLAFLQGNCKGQNPLRKYDLCDSGCLHTDSFYLVPVLKMHHKTLEMLYLQYDGGGRSTATCIKQLAASGVGELRELHIVADGKIFDEEISSIVNKELALLLSCCPLLEILVITTSKDSSVSMAIQDVILQTIAYNCSQLRRLVICGRDLEITTHGLFDLSTAAHGFQHLEYIQIDCRVRAKDLIDLTQKLKHLKTAKMQNMYASRDSSDNLVICDVFSGQHT